MNQLSEIGIKVINDYKTIMQWNRVFCVNKMFPHPNHYIKMGKSDQPVFLESFLEVKLELNKWVKLNITNWIYENMELRLLKIFFQINEELTVKNMHLAIINFHIMISRSYFISNPSPIQQHGGG